jgi:hypothetical protein
MDVLKGEHHWSTAQTRTGSGDTFKLTGTKLVELGSRLTSRRALSAMDQAVGARQSPAVARQMAALKKAGTRIEVI